MMMSAITPPFISVYGPVTSWRFGRSLGIDPIGSRSCCSFNCVYCQLGAIEQPSCHRQIFVPTAQIESDLQSFLTCQFDTIALSGSGEPTLAKNLGEILAMLKGKISKPIGVLTNGSLLSDAAVRQELSLADWVSVKVDAIDGDSFRRIDRPLPEIDLDNIWAGLLEFRRLYSGRLAVQTMLLKEWSDLEQFEYMRRMQALQPDEIQLNTPSRPRPLTHQLAARGNSLPDDIYPIDRLKQLEPQVLQKFANRLEYLIEIPVRLPQPLAAS